MFEGFTFDHNEYHETLIDEDDLEESDTYFYDKQLEYISVLNMAKEFGKQKVVKTESPSESNTDKADDLSRDEFLRLLNLPKVELEVYHGNPLHYHQFMRAFEVNVGKVCKDPDLKLSRLMQYTAGPPKEAIRGCQLIGGETGYTRACLILNERFGNAHLVTERLMRELKLGKSVRSPTDIRQLADDMQNAFLVLNQLEMLQEVNSQAVILEIVGRFPNYVQMRWRKLVFKTKSSTMTDNKC